MAPYKYMGRYGGKVIKNRRKLHFFLELWWKMIDGDCNMEWLARLIVSAEVEFRNQLSSIPRLPLRGHPLSWHPKSKGHLPFATRFLRISFYQFCFPWLSLFEELYPHVFWGGFSRARTCAPSLGFPLFCFHNLHTRPVSNSKNRVAVVTWN